eukprot:scaffold6357_cov70-Phaeocystis_antarctica.AAC.3
MFITKKIGSRAEPPQALQKPRHTQGRPWGRRRPAPDRPVGQKCPRAALTPLATASARPVLRQRVEAQSAGTARMASPWAGPTREPAWAGLGATRGVATALAADPRPRLLRGARREIDGCAARSAPSGRDARGIACPPPGVNRDPPAQCRRGPLARRSAHS